MSEVQEARRREESFLDNLADAQDDWDWINEHEAWKTLGWDAFADWWTDRVVPLMRGLSMRPTREIAARVVEQVRADEAELPPAQRRTQRELAELAGTSEWTVAGRRKPVQDQPEPRVSPTADLEQPTPPPEPDPDPLPAPIAAEIERRVEAKQNVATALERYAPDPDAAKRQWQMAFLGAMKPAYRLMGQFAVEQVAEQADDECVEELRRLAAEVSDYCQRVQAARPNPDNVRHLRAV